MLFITLLSPKARGNEVIQSLKSLEERGAIKIRDVFFTFGRYDGVVIFEAPNEKMAMDFIIKASFSTYYAVETLIAVPVKEL